MPIPPCEGYELGHAAFKLFPHWLAQQQPLPEEPSPDLLEQMLETAFIAGYMRDHKE